MKILLPELLHGLERLCDAHGEWIEVTFRNGLARRGKELWARREHPTRHLGRFAARAGGGGRPYGTTVLVPTLFKEGQTLSVRSCLPWPIPNIKSPSQSPFFSR